MEEISCIFCQIANGNAQAKIVYQDNDVIAFLDINPLAPGHTLVIPKKHIQNVFEMDDDLLHHIFTVAKQIAENMRKNLGAEGVNFLQSNGEAAEQSVFHFHLHIIPRWKNDGLDFTEYSRTKIKKMRNEELEKIAKIIEIKSDKETRSEEEIYSIKRELEIG